jgi:hypothetical protein
MQQNKYWLRHVPKWANPFFRKQECPFWGHTTQ